MWMIAITMNLKGDNMKVIKQGNTTIFQCGKGQKSAEGNKKDAKTSIKKTKKDGN